MFRPSPQQRKAIEAPLGPVLVVAGPGAGKTYCLIGRIGYLVSKLKIPAERICAVTFTNKAAEEIAARLADDLKGKAAAVRRGTIHALCAEILREFPRHAGLTAGFGIADEDYQRTLLRQMRQGPRAGQLLQLFSRYRLEGRPLTPGDVRLFAEYQRTLRRRNLVDFDDLVVLVRDLFLARPETAAQVAGRYDYVLVDEFQDVNNAQYAVLKALAAPHNNIFAVGDDEQSIFSWTGANPKILQAFEADYGIGSPVLLDVNHRTSRQIFAMARRLLTENPSLFDAKKLEAQFDGGFEVRAVGHPDDDAEAAWLIADLEADRAAHWADDRKHPLGWGDYAVLYRKHEIGARLERAFIKAGLPCRLAKGKALSEDRVIGQVLTALKLVRDPRDNTAAEAFAQRVLPEHLVQRVQSEVSGEADFLLAVRDLAGAMPQGDPDTKKLWRLIYGVENLAAMRQKHSSLLGLVEELLTERQGIFTNALEERHEDLADPAELPAAQALARKLAPAQRGAARVVIEPLNGLEIALRGLLFQAGFKHAAYADEVAQPELDDVRLGQGDAGPEGLAFTLFKALQSLHARGLGEAPKRYVTFDLETTDLDTRTCEIIEIAAVRAERGVVTGEFHSLVRPEGPIAPEASVQHGYSDADVAGAPTFAEVWPRFAAFVAGDPLVAHNGQKFDVPVLRRMVAAIGGAERIQAYDTLPLAQAVGGGSAKLTALAERFGVPVGRAHHALDDSRMLVGVFEALEQRRLVRARKASLVNLLAYLGLALAIEGPRDATEEVALLRRLTYARALGRFTDCLEYYEAERARAGTRGPSPDEVIVRLGGRERMEKLREERDASSRYPEAVARLEALIDQAPGEPLDEAARRLLERVALSAEGQAQVEPHRINLLTLHSTKGLEFSRVYIVGVEDDQLPGWVAKDEDPQHALEEARRLLYVGMTRAVQRLVLTTADKRAGRTVNGHRFLGEMQLELERAGEPVVP